MTDAERRTSSPGCNGNCPNCDRRCGERQVHPGSSERDWIAADPRRAAQARVSPNTLVRLGQWLGYPTYDHLRQPFREALKQGPHTISSQARWLQQLGQGEGFAPLYAQMAAASVSNLQRTFSENDPHKLEQAALDLHRLNKLTSVLGSAQLVFPWPIIFLCGADGDAEPEPGAPACQRAVR